MVTTGTLAADHPTPEADRRLAWLLLLSCIPGGVTGALLETPIEDHLGQIWLIGIMLIVFGLILYWADHLAGDRHVTDFRLRDALLMGTGQALALSPGVSRSGVTISVGRKLGFDRDAAARLSFLMGLPIIGGAVALQARQAVRARLPARVRRSVRLGHRGLRASAATSPSGSCCDSSALGASRRSSSIASRSAWSCSSRTRPASDSPQRGHHRARHDRERDAASASRSRTATVTRCSSTATTIAFSATVNAGA